MDKLIKDLESIVNRYRTDVESLDSELSKFWFGVSKGHDDVAFDVSLALKRYQHRQLSLSQKLSLSCDDFMKITHDQFERIIKMVDCASDRQSALYEVPTGSYTASFYRGYISAVHCLMDILNINVQVNIDEHEHEVQTEQK